MKLNEVVKALQTAVDERKFNRLAFLKLYPPQQKFCALGATKPERILLGGNQTGKTTTGGLEATYHITGDYPDWWEGKRFDEPTTGWVCGVTAQATRDKPQEILCGPPGVVSGFGTGLIPRDRFIRKANGDPDISLARGVTDAYDMMQVRHKSGGTSVVNFKSYDQGREKFQSGTLDWIWNDEEPPMDVYAEELPRLIAKKGVVFTTLTPMKGPTQLTNRFYVDKVEGSGLVMLTIDDVSHYTPEEKKAIIARYPVHERKARAYGIPMLGSGAVFITPQEVVSEEAIEHLPKEWTKLWGIDFGIDHPFAAVLSAWDRESDVIHITHAFRLASSISGKEEDGLPVIHAAAMKRIAAAAPVAWPHDGHQRDKGSGKHLSVIYKDAGLLMLPDHAQFPDGGYSTEGAVQDMQTRCADGRFKVAAHLSEFFTEYRSYHRKDGLLVKMNDDILSAVFKVIMAKQHGKPVQLGSQMKKKSRQSYICEGTYDNPLDWGHDNPLDWGNDNPLDWDH